MRIKKFIAATMKDGKALVMKELGEDAVILSSRNSKNPTSGEEYVEIVAAIDESPAKKKQLSPASTKEPSTEKRAEKPQKHDDDLYEHIIDIKNEIKKISDYAKYKYSGALAPKFAKLYNLLRFNEIPEEVALETVALVSAKDINAEYSTIIESAKRVLAEKILVSNSINEIEQQKIVTFLGPTGTGKTTALVKIAVVCKLLLKADILIISADTYKVGGAEQLQTISSIAGISFKSVYSPEELKEEIARESKRDLIFVDTTGRSQNNEEHIDELRSYCEAAGSHINYLVINAGSSESSVRQIIEKHSKIVISSVILSKIDEAAALGGIISVLAEKQVPISYITNGQQIPDDLEPADKTKLVELLVRNEL